MKLARNFYLFRSYRPWDYHVEIRLTSAATTGRGRKKGPFIELRIGGGKGVGIAWLTPKDARQVGYELFVASAEVQTIRKRH